MGKIGIVYYSRGGNTEKMAHAVYEGAKSEAGVEVELKKAEETSLDELTRWDGIIVGSPTYYGLPAAPVKELFDRSVKRHGMLEGKVGGAFSSSANVGGGNETTIMGIIQMMLIHGMIVKGSSKGDHYGPVSLGEPDERVKKQCKNLGATIAKMVKKMPIC
ncbi:NAD(P)H-dependent oxidoreductase [Candidatus Aerophobetes bacterium]|nr:NAD(P)H-dependent oxidoreductase [Candidatus Aerophobetes bacterium]